MTGVTKYLQLELNHWKDDSVRPRMFLRDDDCIDVTAELETLTGFIEQRDIPLMLAVIPEFATKELGRFVSDHKLITPAVHGFSHTNHASEGEKKCEFGDNRDQEEMLSEMRSGRKTLEGLFAQRLSPLFVAPWNRIGEKATSVYRDAGFTGISGFGWSARNDKIRRVNTHVDVIDWKAGKVGKTFDVLVNEMRTNLEMARLSDFAPVGILTHHLANQDWETLGRVFDEIGEIKWISAGV